METMTVKEALEATVRILNGIEVPVGYMQKIGIPIANAAGNIIECIRAMDEADKKKEEPEIVIENEQIEEATDA